MTESKVKNHALIATLMLAAVAVIWGMGFPVTQMAINANLAPGVVVATRFWVAAIAIGLIFLGDMKTLTRSDIKYGAVGGIILSMAFLLQVSGQQFTTPSNSAFLSSTNVVMVPFLSWAFFKIKPTKKLVAVSICCLLGAAVLTISPQQGLVLNIGDSLTILCAIMFSLHIAYLGSVAGRVSAQKLTFIQTLTAAIIGTVYMLIFEMESLPQCDFSAGLLPIVYLGLLSTAFSFFAQSYAQKHTSPTRAAIILSTEGLLGSIFSVALGYEPITVNLIVGGLIIFTSLIAMEIDPRAIIRARSTESAAE